MNKKPVYYYLNKYLYFPPFLLWRWIGLNCGFKGSTYWERFNHLNELELKLGVTIGSYRFLNNSQKNELELIRQKRLNTSKIDLCK